MGSIFLLIATYVFFSPGILKKRTSTWAEKMKLGQILKDLFSESHPITTYMFWTKPPMLPELRLVQKHLLGKKMKRFFWIFINNPGFQNHACQIFAFIPLPFYCIGLLGLVLLLSTHIKHNAVIVPRQKHGKISAL